MADQQRPGRGDGRRGGGAARSGGAQGRGGSRDGGRGDRAPRAPGARAPRGDRRDGPAAGGPRGSHGDDRTAEQARYDGPDLPDDITGRELDVAVRQQLRSLPDRLAARVARHLVAAGRLLDEDPETAYLHTLAARGRAARLAVIREACGEAAYLAGHYAEALTELRAARRMNGAVDYLPVMADCERAQGKPDRALALARDPAVEHLDQDGRVEMLIVASGARLDLGQPDMAVRTLEGKELRSSAHAPRIARLRYAYAEALLACDRRPDAVEWFHRAAAVDGQQVTAAAERIAELEGLGVAEPVETVETGDAAAPADDRDG